MNLGVLNKLKSKVDEQGCVYYELPLGEKHFELNNILGKKVSLEHTGKIQCTSCNRKIKKTYQGGYCYPCVISLPETDLCMVKPENCHFHLGTCRNSAWGKEHCFIDHTVYLANSSGMKVGITRSYRKINRWIDQGAVQAIPILQTKDRLHAGLVEVFLKKNIADKTNWRKMLQGKQEDVDLLSNKKTLIESLKENFKDVETVEDRVWNFSYPVLCYPEKIISLNFSKTKLIEGIITGIKGQYLIFEHGVLNIRKFSGYEICFSN